MIEEKNYYQILGVASSATLDEIKKSYKKLDIQCHPDRNSNNREGVKKFKANSEAYKVLSKPEQRIKYDLYGSLGEQQQTNQKQKIQIWFNDFTFQRAYQEIFKQFFDQNSEREEVIEINKPPQAKKKLSKKEKNQSKKHKDTLDFWGLFENSDSDSDSDDFLQMNFPSFFDKMKFEGNIIKNRKAISINRNGSKSQVKTNLNQYQLQFSQYSPNRKIKKFKK